MLHVLKADNTPASLQLNQDKTEHMFSRDKKQTLCKMVNESSNRSSVVESETTHRCNLSCLGPLTFHPQAVGAKVRLSQGCRQAEKTENTFKNGLVFSSRAVRIQERIRLRVEKDLINWQGALRVGFTTVAPEARSLPLPIMAIPDLTKTPGHWAAPVHESHCQAGSELEFWVSHTGSVYVASNGTKERKLLSGVDLSQPLWAMIDIYGQTCAISLLGSEKRGLFLTRRSCPAPERLTSPEVNNHYSLIHDFSRLRVNSDASISSQGGSADGDIACVVCMQKQPSVTLPCGHRCLCERCGPKVIQQFGSCPLCRQKIMLPSAEADHLPWQL